MFDNYNGNQGSTPTTPATPQDKTLRFDKKYVKTPTGMLKIVQLLCNLIGFICIKVSWAWVSAIFYNILYWVGILITSFILLAYTFHVVEKYDRLPWLKLELFYCVLMALAYIVTSIFAATIGESVGYTVGFFGLVAIGSYGFDGYLKYKAWKRGLPPQ